jgi:type IV secretory pathway TraG/TraD family ATPase VirD4
MNPKLIPFLLSGALLLGFPPPAVAQLPTQAVNDNFESLKKLLFNPQGGMIGGSILVMIFLSWQSGNAGPKAKNRLATSRWAGSKEKSAARKKAHQQMNDRRANAVSLFIAAPKLTYLPIALAKPNKAAPNPSGQKIVKITQDQTVTWLPDAQRGLAVLGGPGSGKTHSVIDPALRSVIDQGFPLILYDFVRFVG